MVGWSNKVLSLIAMFSAFVIAVIIIQFIGVEFEGIKNSNFSLNSSAEAIKLFLGLYAPGLITLIVYINYIITRRADKQKSYLIEFQCVLIAVQSIFAFLYIYKQGR